MVDDLGSNRVYEFPCHSWISKSFGGQLQRDLKPKKEQVETLDEPEVAPVVVPVRATTDYEIRVVTGDKRDATTTSDVYLIIHADKRELRKWFRNKDKGSKDKHGKKHEKSKERRKRRHGDAESESESDSDSESESESESDIDDKRHSRKGSRSGSRSSNSSRSSSSSRKHKKRKRRDAQRSSSSDDDDEEDDEHSHKRHGRKRKAKRSHGAGESESDSESESGSESESDDDAKAERAEARKKAKLAKHAERAKKRKLANSERIELTSGKFKHGHTDIFKIQLPTLLSPAYAITIGIKPKGTQSSWYCDRVMVICPKTSLEQTFAVNDWLAYDESDRKIERFVKQSGRKSRK